MMTIKAGASPRGMDAIPGAARQWDGDWRDDRQLYADALIEFGNALVHGLRGLVPAAAGAPFRTLDDIARVGISDPKTDLAQPPDVTGTGIVYGTGDVDVVSNLDPARERIFIKHADGTSYWASIDPPAGS